MTRPLRIAMLAHSTNPRGGVVHALHLSEALATLGHEVVLHAPDASGAGFFRAARCATRAVSGGAGRRRHARDDRAARSRLCRAFLRTPRIAASTSITRMTASRAMRWRR